MPHLLAPLSGDGAGVPDVVAGSGLRALPPRRPARAVDGSPCRFFRFSRFDPGRPHSVTRYFPRLNMSNVGAAAETFGRYVTLLEAAGYNETRTWPYAYGHFTNGRPVPDRARHLYRRLGAEAERFGDPFDTASSESFFRWSRRQRGGLRRMKRYWWAAHRVTGEVRRALASPPGP